MKNIKLLIFLSSIALLVNACSESSSDKSESNSFALQKMDIPEDEDDFPLHNPGISEVVSESDLLLEINAKVRLEELSPIASVGTKLRIDRARQNDVVASYNEFLKKHQEDTLLIRHFKGRYAKKLLLEYDIIQTSDAQMLSFFIEELIRSETGRFGTIIAALKRLDKIEDRKMHKDLICQVQCQVEKSLYIYKEVQAQLPELIEKAKENGYNKLGHVTEDFPIALLKDDFTKKIQILGRYKSELLIMEKNGGTAP